MRTAMVGLLGLVVLAGCGDSHRPEARTLPTKGEDATASPHGTMGSPHGTTRGGPGAEGAAAEATGPEVELGPMRLKAPEGWVRTPRKSDLIRAEFALPRAEGDQADGRLTVTIAGGTIKDNLDRWRGQFGGKPAKESQEQIKVDDVAVTLVDYAGAYSDQHMAGAPGPAGTGSQDSRMLGAVYDLGDRLLFVKASGPAKTMAAHAARFRQFVESLKSGRAPKATEPPKASEAPKATKPAK